MNLNFSKMALVALCVLTLCAMPVFAILPVPDCFPCGGDETKPPDCFTVELCVCPLGACELTGGPVCVTIYTNCLRQTAPGSTANTGNPLTTPGTEPDNVGVRPPYLPPVTYPIPRQ